MIQFIDDFGARLFVRPGITVFDIGASRGTLSELYLNLGAAKVFGFEPRQKARENLPKGILMDTRFNVMPYALGDQSGITDIYIPNRNPDAASVRQDFFEGLVRGRSDNMGTVEKVDIRRLDDLNLPRAQFWKIDAEGAELEIFAGAHDNLINSTPDAIQVEIFFYDKDRYIKTINLIKSYFPHVWAIGKDENGKLLYYDVDSEIIAKINFHQNISRMGTPIYFASVKPLAAWSLK